MLVATVRVRNTASTDLSLQFRVGPRVLQQTTIKAGSTATIRLAWARDNESASDISLWISGSSPEWVLDSAELSNRYGFSSGLLNLEVVPSGQSVPRAPLWSVVLVSLLAAGAASLKPRPSQALRRRLGVLAGGIANAIGLVVLTVVIAAPLFSRFAIVLAPRTFALLVILLLSSRAADAARAGSAWFVQAAARTRWVAPCGWGALSAAFFASAMLQLLANYQGNYSGFLHLSRGLAARAPFLAERPDLTRTLIQYDLGYDGEFMYLMAFDPFLNRFSAEPQRYRDVVDAPPYRYGRIGFSLLTRALSSGRAERFPASMMWLIIGAHFLLASAMAAIALHHGSPSAATMLLLTIPGYMASLVFALPEPLAAAAVVMGLLLLQRERLVGAGLCFAGALLIRETASLFAAAALVAAWPRLGRPQGIRLAMGFFIPVIAWRLYVGWRLMQDFGTAAFFPSPGDLTVPFTGLGQLFVAGLTGSQPAPEALAARAFPLLLAGAFGVSLWLLARKPDPWRAATAAYGAVAVSLNYEQIWSHVPSGERGTYELFLGLLLTLVIDWKADRTARRLLLIFFGALCLYTVLLSPQAAASRAALLILR
jgi:hypothetical protein